MGDGRFTRSLPIIVNGAPKLSVLFQSTHHIEPLDRHSLRIVLDLQHLPDLAAIAMVATDDDHRRAEVTTFNDLGFTVSLCSHRLQDRPGHAARGLPVDTWSTEH